MSENTPDPATVSEPAADAKASSDTSAATDAKASSDTSAASDASASSDTSENGLTDDDLKITREAAVRATALTSMAEKGFIDQFKEAFAASKAIKSAPKDVQNLLVGGMPSLPSSHSPQELESETLGLINQASTLIAAKAPQLLEGYQSTLLSAVSDVAAASGGTSDNEQQVIDKIKAAFAS